MRRFPFPLMACLGALAVATAAGADRVPHVHALVGARIVQAPGQVLESGTLIVRDGLIEAVGSDLEPPADARVWELEDLTLYPGLIESFHLRDWPAEDEDHPPQGGHPNTLVRPERDMLLHAHDEGAFKKLRDAGFTTAVLAPRPGLFRGAGVLVNLGDEPLGGEVLRRDLFQNVSLAARSDSGYPNSAMGAIALFRQTLLDARWHADAQAAFADNPRQQRPEYSTALAALEAAVRGRQPVVMESDSLSELLRLARLAEEFELDAVLVGSGEEYRRLDEVAKTVQDSFLILPIPFPETPDVKDEDDLTVDLETLRHWHQAPENPRLLAEAGVPFVLTSHRLSEPKKLHEMAAQAIERGFSADDVLAALTTGPAERLGLAERAGTLEVGKMANIVISDGDLFSAETKIRSVWIDGRRYEIKKIEPPTVDPLGTWEVTVNTGDGVLKVTLTLTGSVEDLDGTIGTPMGSLPLSDAYVSGDTVEVAFDSTPLGIPGTITFSASIDGDSASGPGSSPEGPFTFTARRTSRPDSPEKVLFTSQLLTSQEVVR